MAVSVYDKAFLSEEQQKKLQQVTLEWERANAAGDTAAMASAHSAAEAIRQSGYGYSGGDDGTQFNKLSADAGYTATALPSYTARTSEVNSAYDAAQQLRIAQLKTAYDDSLAALNNTKNTIPATYQRQKMATAAASEQAKLNFNEYANASGLNSGAAGQAELARSNQLQSDLSALSAAEASAVTDVDNQIAQLKVKYNNDLATAIAEGEYERAAALLEEYREQERSLVSTASAQADENYRAYSAAANAANTSYERQLAAEQTAYERQKAAEETAYERQRAEEQTAYERQQSEEETAYAREQQSYQQALTKAKTMAQYGDFSGYLALGYDQSTVNYMRRVWLAQNGL